MPSLESCKNMYQYVTMKVGRCLRLAKQCCDWAGCNAMPELPFKSDPHASFHTIFCEIFHKPRSAHQYKAYVLLCVLPTVFQQSSPPPIDNTQYNHSLISMSQPSIAATDHSSVSQVGKSDNVCLYRHFSQHIH